MSFWKKFWIKKRNTGNLSKSNIPFGGNYKLFFLYFSI
nr:MAG TPA: hypothetical protein [Caudoviricetes sp.]